MDYLPFPALLIWNFRDKIDLTKRRRDTSSRRLPHIHGRGNKTYQLPRQCRLLRRLDMLSSGGGQCLHYGRGQHRGSRGRVAAGEAATAEKVEASTANDCRLGIKKHGYMPRNAAPINWKSMGWGHHAWWWTWPEEHRIEAEMETKGSSYPDIDRRKKRPNFARKYD